jgi:eukaryotic-like serine/threonine-protein kinase
MSGPAIIGQYRIGERIAIGGAGEIYAAVDTKLGRDVAIKFLRPELASDPEWVARFFAEAKSLGRLNHPNIATLYTLDHDDTHLCMIMELVRGQTIEKILQARGRPLGIRESLAILVQVADGLSYAHEQGVFHRDIKPSNLMATESGRVKIMDFGIARVRGSERMTRAGTAVGTLLYMSPEQCRGLEGDERSDIYSLAVVLYELLAGAPPFKAGSEFELTKAHISAQPPPLIPRVAGVEPPLEFAIMKALAKRPEQRFPSMRAFSDATGASALRGDATGIIHGCLRTAQGSDAALDTAKRLPFHTVALAVARSRLAAAMRRFREFHPAVQLGLAGAVVLGAAGAMLLRPEPGPEPQGQKVADKESPKEYQPPIEPKHDIVQPIPKQGKQPEIPLVVKGKLAGNDQKFEPQLDKPPVANPEFGDAGHKNLAERDESLAATPDRQFKPPSSDEGRIFPKHEAALNTQSWESAWKRKDYGQAFEIATKLDAAGNPGGAYGLGVAYHTGNGIADIDEDKAFEAFKRAANAGFGPAQLKLGLIYYEGTSAVRKNHLLARHWLEEAAKNDVGEAAYALSVMCHKKQGGLTRDCEQDWLDKAADLRYSPKQ